MANLTQKLKVQIEADNKASPALKKLQEDSNKALGSKETGAPKGIAALSKGATVALGAATIAIGALAAGVTASVQKAAEFEQKMSKVKAITGSTGEDFDKLTQLARDMGSQTAFSASEAADGITFLGQAGFKADQIMQALPDTLNLAAAGGIGLGEAADIASNVLSGMRLPVEELKGVTDGLAVAASNSNTSITGMGSAFAMAAPGAAAAGVSFDEVAAALGVLGDNGIQASAGGTALNAALRTMIKPSREAEQAARRLGVSFTNQDGTIKDLVDIVSDLETANVKAKDVMVLFGEEGGRAINALVGSGSARLRSLQSTIENSDGAAGAMAKTMNDNFAGSMKTLGSVTDDLMITVGNLFLPLLKQLLDSVIVPGVQKLTAFVNAVDGIGDTMGEMVDSASGWISKASSYIFNTENAAASTGKLKKETEGLATAQRATQGSLFSTSTSIQILTQKEDAAAKAAEKLANETRRVAEYHQRNFAPAMKRSGDEAFKLSGKVEEVELSMGALPEAARTGTGGMMMAFNDTLKNPNTGFGAAMSGGIDSVISGGGFKAAMQGAGQAIGMMIGGPLGAIVGQGLGSVVGAVTGLFSGKGKADKRKESIAELQSSIGQGDIAKFNNFGQMKEIISNAGSAKITLDAFKSVFSLNDADAAELISGLASGGLNSAQLKKFNEQLGAVGNREGFRFAEQLAGGRSAAPPSSDPPPGDSGGDTSGGAQGVRDYLQSAVLNQRVSRSRLQGFGASAISEAIGSDPVMNTLRSGLIDLANGGSPDLTPFNNFPLGKIDIMAGAGLHGVFNKPTTVMFGEQGPERVDISPLRGDGGFSGSGGSNYHFNFNINANDARGVKDFIENDAREFIVNLLRRESERGRDMLFNTGVVTAPTV